MIIDSFPFFDEIELLDLRLNYLDNVVEKFLIVEGTKSHQGKDKKLFFDENKSLFKKFNKKIIHHIVDDYPQIKNLEDFDHFQYDYHTRNGIGHGLKKINYKDSDILLISDVDEIPDISFFEYFRGNLTIFKQYMMYFKMNLRCTGFEYDYGDGLWPGTRMILIKDFTTAQKIRNIKPKQYGWWRIDKKKIDFFFKAGWHFRYLGDEKKLLDEFKNRSIGYSEKKLLNYSLSDLENIIKNQLELIGGEKYQTLDENSLPKIILENKKKYKKFLI